MTCIQTHNNQQKLKTIKFFGVSNGNSSLINHFYYFQQLSILLIIFLKILIIGEGVSGALLWKDLVLLAKKIGFSIPLLVSVTPINFKSEEIRKLIGKYQILLFISFILIPFFFILR